MCFSVHFKLLKLLLAQLNIVVIIISRIAILCFSFCVYEKRSRRSKTFEGYNKDMAVVHT